ncbi:hypothetical protein [Frankia canadensis]|nr:hypothetical protein [Frankia canadensis]
MAAATTAAIVVFAALLVGGGPASADSSGHFGPYSVVDSWKAKTGETVYLRVGSWDGNRGSGYTKIVNYHNLTTAAVKAATLYSKDIKPQGGTTKRFETPVEHVECHGASIFRTCRVIEVITLVAVVNFRPLGDGTTFGVVTAFCDNRPPRCPDWVKDAINI